MAKWVAIVRAPERIPEYVARAYQTALSGRPGPVVLGFPEDVLREAVADARTPPACAPPCPAPSSAEMARLAGQARGGPAPACPRRRPRLEPGGGPEPRRLCRRLRHSHRQRLPPPGPLRQPPPRLRRPCRHRPRSQARRRASAAPTSCSSSARRPGEVTTGAYSLVSVPDPAQFLAHAHPSADEIGRLYRTDLPIVAAPGRSPSR